MKKSLFIASALLISAVAFGQKKELREVEKKIRRGDLNAAQSLLEQTKSIASEGEYASYYYFLKGQLNLANAKKNTNILTSLQNISSSFAKIKEIEGNKGKYVTEMQPIVNEAINIATTQAQQAYQSNDFKRATVAFEQVYRLNPKDTVFLYNAAVLAAQSKDYDTALKHYEELKNMKYDGTEILYVAKEKQTGKEEQFVDKNRRDMMVKQGLYTNPRVEKTPSKRPEIVRNVAAIYFEQGKHDQALKAFEDARKLYPKDANLVALQAGIYLQLDDKNKFKQLMEEAVLLDPNNPDLQYNIGYINLEQGDYEGARKAFEQALKLKPDYADAILNISTTYLREGNALVEIMNNLGNSKADVAKYEQLRQKKDDFFKKGADVLEDYISKQEKTESILEQLKLIYGALGDSANFQRIKKILGE